MSETPAGMAVITLSRDNPSELRVTVESVRRQTQLPDQYLIVDSSSEEFRSEMEEIAGQAGAQYFWMPPHGIYAAMSYSIDLVEANSFALWLNSSDRFATPEAIRMVREYLPEVRVPDLNTKWIVGALARRTSKNWGVHHMPRGPHRWLLSLRSGRIGFPHPSTWFSIDALREVKAYTSQFAIAEDYATALRFAERFGPPLLFPRLVSIHTPNGYSYFHPIRGYLDRARARAEVVKGSFLLGRLVRDLFFALRGLVNRIRGVTSSTPPAEIYSQINQEESHFCDSRPADRWPYCCDEWLESAAGGGVQ